MTRCRASTSDLVFFFHETCQTSIDEEHHCLLQDDYSFQEVALRFDATSMEKIMRADFQTHWLHFLDFLDPLRDHQKVKYLSIVISFSILSGIVYSRCMGVTSYHMRHINNTNIQ